MLRVRVPSSCDATLLRGALLAGLLVFGVPVGADAVRVRNREGAVHAPLVLKDDEGQTIAVGEILQTVGASGRELELHLRFRFHDGSLLAETSVFSQDDRFRLLKHVATHKGPSFKDSLQMTIDVRGGRVEIDHTDGDGKHYETDERLELPEDLANGLLPVLVRNAGGESLVVSLLAATPKPRLVRVHLDNLGEDAYSLAGQRQTALRYRLKIEIGGVTGVLASVVGKTPPDAFMWISPGPVPSFVRSWGPLAPDTPPWAIEPVSPEWPRGAAGAPPNKPRP